MNDTKLWSFGRGPGSLSYKIFDALRRYLNGKLSSYLFLRAKKENFVNIKTLEAGSGPGFCSSLLVGKDGVHSSVILDFDREPLSIAAKRNDGVMGVQGDLLHIPFKDSSFDLVFNSSTMEHLDSFNTAFKEIVRVAQDRGKIFIGVPYKYGPFFAFNFLPQKNSPWEIFVPSKTFAPGNLLHWGIFLPSKFFDCP